MAKAHLPGDSMTCSDLRTPYNNTCNGPMILGPIIPCFFSHISCSWEKLGMLMQLHEKPSETLKFLPRMVCIAFKFEYHWGPVDGKSERGA